MNLFISVINKPARRSKVAEWCSALGCRLSSYSLNLKDSKTNYSACSICHLLLYLPSLLPEAWPWKDTLQTTRLQQTKLKAAERVLCAGRSNGACLPQA